MRRGLFLYCIATIIFLFTASHATAQLAPDSVIQIDGVTMTADSLRAVADVIVEVKGKNRGTETAYTGVFSMVCEKGDTLKFSCIGFRSKEFVIAKDLKGDLFSMIQLMVQDTFYLPETIIRPLPSKERFNYAFQHWQVPNDQYELARRNTNAYMLRALAYTMPIDGRTAQSRLMAQQANQAVYYGQQQPMNILSPIAWGQFFEAWKRGDFRKQSNPYLDNSSY
jgi:hypothetical protein